MGEFAEGVNVAVGSAVFCHLIARLTRAREFPHMLSGAMLLGAWLIPMQALAAGQLAGAVLVTLLVAPRYWREVKAL